VKHSDNFYWPHTFGGYLTPEQAYENDKKANGGSMHTLAEYKRMARKTNDECDCGRPVWRLVGLGMCFTCITGESDASDDYELEPAL